VISYDNYKTIAVHRRGRVLTLTINRPEVLNAVNAMLHEEMARIFYDVALDRETDIVVFTGAGRAFCAGGDINWMQQMIDDPEIFETTGIEGKRIVFSLLDLDKPVICRMNGDGIGLGATMALFCDIIVAADTAKIGDPHARVGLGAGDGGAVIWPQLIGYARAKEYLMTGDLIPAPVAARMGLINYAVPESELDAKVDVLADKLAGGATKAIRWSKVAAKIGLKQLAHSIMDASIAYETLSNVSRDHAEAVNAFREKRKPCFGGTSKR
jgi:enoyl-CoA hydratase